jgi:hypothetical protein
VLNVELDATLCPLSNRSIYEFLKWDYIGAPWEPGFRHCNTVEHCVGNSGLAIFTRSVMQRIAATYDDKFFDSVVDHDCIDCWLCVELQRGKVRGNVAPVSVARFFSVEGVYDGTYTPFGTHKAVANLGKDSSKHKLLRSLLQGCPEARLAACDSLGRFSGAGWKCN